MDSSRNAKYEGKGTAWIPSVTIDLRVASLLPLIIPRESQQLGSPATPWLPTWSTNSGKVGFLNLTFRIAPCAVPTDIIHERSCCHCQRSGERYEARGDQKKECSIASCHLSLARLRRLMCGDNEGIVFDPDGFNLRWKLEFVAIGRRVE